MDAASLIPTSEGKWANYIHDVIEDTYIYVAKERIIITFKVDEGCRGFHLDFLDLLVLEILIYCLN